MQYVELDVKGRIVLPKTVREAVSTSKFEVDVDNGNRVVLTPVLPPRKLFGAFPTTDGPVNRFHDIEKTDFS